MGPPPRRESYSGPLLSTAYQKDHHYHHHHHHHYSYPHDQRIFEFVANDETCNLVSPFDKLERFSEDDIRETAYEIFFTACRSSPGFGGRNAHSFHININNQNESKSSNVVMSPTSRVKKALGLKMLKRSPSRRMTSGGSSGGPSSPVSGGTPFHHSMSMYRPRRPMTSAEIMRQQMKVTEHNDNRLRKTIMRTLVGQVRRRAETIIIPLELLRHLKPTEFSDSHEYHMWQKRQLRVLELGLLTHPLITVEKNSTFASRLRDIIRNCESKPLDTGKNSDALRTLCNSVVSLAWRGQNGAPTDVCHWADGFPLNIHFYNSLLQAIFDIRDETLVLDEVDELLELIKKTWSILGITKSIHNICFAWILFQQYVATGQVEFDLLSASNIMLIEVGNDTKKEKDSFYLKLLTSVLSSMQSWGEKRLLNYHEFFPRGTICQIENLLPLVLSVSKILGEDLMITDVGEGRENGDTITIVDSSGDRIDYYIRSSMKNAFDKVIEAVNAKYAELQVKGELSAILLHIAQETEELAIKERQSFSPILKKWHPTASASAALMLHSCYGHVLRQYLSDVTSLTCEAVEVLQRAGKLEKVFVQMVVEDVNEGDENGKTVVKDMVPYEVDSVILNLLRKWIHEALCKGRECLQRAKETETWNPKSKSEPYAQSASEMVKSAKTTVEEFFQIPIGITEELVQDLADGLETIFQDYMMFVAACGSKQSYIPALPPLTRCNRDSTIIKFWRKASPCGANLSELDHVTGTNEGHNPRPSTSRGTQRLYIRLNTLHYLLAQIHSLEKLLSQNPSLVPPTRPYFTNSQRSQSTKTGSYFEIVNTSLPAACQHVSEVAAYRLIFLDSNSVFYDSLYIEDVANARIRPALRILKQNLTLMTTLLVDRAQPLAMKEVMRASFDAFLMVLLAGGNSRVFNRSDHVMIHEDFESLNKVFCTCGEGLVSENVVEREAAVVEGVIELMAQNTEQLMEDFSIATCETSGIGGMSINGQKLHMPPTTGRWNRSDPNTILRVLCHRNDRTANYFLKRTFQLPKRR
ncbi:protein unc-13 protein [Trifolium repens]|nr:protein unc-13 protein [Trifolium repens]